MILRCVVTHPDGSVLCTNNVPIEEANIRSLANVGHVTRLLRASNVVPEIGQKLTVWIED